MRGALTYFSDERGGNPMLEIDYPYSSGNGDDTTGCQYSESKATKAYVSSVPPVKG